MRRSAMNIKKIITIGIIILFLFVIMIIKERMSPPETYHIETYIVQDGDTAWTIASMNNTANKDVRELIYYMEQDTGINAGYLQIGQEVKIRIYENKKSDVNAVTSTPDSRIDKGT
ncbi:MAG: LysM peptidoglycan-binding domain-containing protein [Clostridia bacterium]|nr:LysM peptidoglycan-binding domain-containing protein [Clostridia bacterium]